MSFAIMLQTNPSPLNYLDKAVVDVARATGTLRENTSISHPSILIDSYLADDMIGKINYMYIETFKRYYYVNEIISIQNHLWRVMGTVDVLMSFKDEIRANRGIISKQRNRWDLYLDDGTFMSDQDPLVQTKVFPNGFNAYEWVLAVAGNQGQTSSST